MMAIYNPDYIQRADFPTLLRQGEIEFSELSMIQRIMLMTDGTLTKMLETYTQEYIDVVKLAENEVTLAEDIPSMWVRAGRKVVDRKILLQGCTTRRNWLYAESIVIPDRLDEEFQYHLLASHTPIGKLWVKHKLETFKERVRYWRESADDLAFHFDLQRHDTLLARTYLVYSNSKPTMMITEKFPEKRFC